MKKGLLFYIVFLFIILPCITAQTNKNSVSGSLVYYNGFNEACTQDINHSLYCVRQLAADKEWGKSLLQDLLHGSFMPNLSSYREMNKTKVNGKELKKFNIACTVLNEMVADTCQLLSGNATPIQYWVNAFLNENDPEYMSGLINDFISTQLIPEHIYNYKTGSYALLIHKIISQKEHMYGLSRKILKEVRDKSVNAVSKSGKPGIHPSMKERAYFRFLYAYCNYAEAQINIEENYINKANDLLKTAFDFSPDFSDIHNIEGFKNDMASLGIEDIDFFRVEYLDFLSTYAFEKEDILNSRLTLALDNPERYKKPLEYYYNNHFAGEKPFSEYWVESINSRGKEVPPFKFAKDDGTLFCSEENQGKWVLLDFWGIWCAPCLREQPEIERFYRNIVKPNEDKVILHTMDCRDTKEQLTLHMNKYNYSFPVAMEDKKILSLFNVSSWPTKILITPQRRYLEIPAGADWVAFVKQYAGL